MRAKPPEALKQRGMGVDGTTIAMEVRICVTPEGLVWSLHGPMGDQDEKLTLKMPGGGHRQIAYGLLTEAVRREAFTCLLTAMSDDPTLLAKLQDAKTRQAEEKALTDKTNQFLLRTASEMVQPSVLEAVEMVLAQKI
jgi:hypothetical protein